MCIHIFKIFWENSQIYRISFTVHYTRRNYFHFPMEVQVNVKFPGFVKLHSYIHCEISAV